MAGTGDVVQFVQRFFRQSLRKAASLVLADKEFAEDVKDAATLEDYIEFLKLKRKRTFPENVFYILPDEDQKAIWDVVKGVHSER